jgi:hypothetical protein
MSGDAHKAGAACAWIRDLMDGKTPVTEAPAEEPAVETPAEEETEAETETPAEPEAPKPASSGSYFGRKSFRTGN